jgi:tetratricopeptide (TPR) repeat protein
MKRIFFLLIVIVHCSFVSCISKSISSQPVNQQVIDSRGNPNLLGRCTKNALQQEPYKTWFDKNYAAYQVDTPTAEQLKPVLRKKRFVIFMGTWCGDSKREVPRIFKLLEYCGVDQSRIQLVMVSNVDSMYKQSPGHEEVGLNIHRVPDLLMFDHNNELGRIVESPVESLEKDLLSIATHSGYVPKYRAVSFLINLFAEKDPRALSDSIPSIADRIKPLAMNSAELNSYGYVLMAAKEMPKAGIVFGLNKILYPAKSGVYDSYGDYCMKMGNRAIAKENYQKALDIDPGNENAKKRLLELSSL